jgi:hypothetical protein
MTFRRPARTSRRAVSRGCDVPRAGSWPFRPSGPSRGRCPIRPGTTCASGSRSQTPAPCSRSRKPEQPSRAPAKKPSPSGTVETRLASPLAYTSRFRQHNLNSAQQPLAQGYGWEGVECGKCLKQRCAHGWTEIAAWHDRFAREARACACTRTGKIACATGVLAYCGFGYDRVGCRNCEMRSGDDRALALSDAHACVRVHTQGRDCRWH